MRALRLFAALGASVLVLGAGSAAAAPLGGELVFSVTSTDPSTARTGGLVIDRGAELAEPVAPLTTDPNETEPAFSPDGRSLVVARDGTAPEDAGIATIAADGSGLRQLTDDPGDTSPSFSPDGSSITFARAGAIYVIGVDGTGLRQLTVDHRGSDSEPVFTPDGGRIVFTRTYKPRRGKRRRRTSGLYSIPVAGGPIEAFVDGKAAESGAAFSPNGELLAYAADGGIVLANADGADRRRLLSAGERSSGYYPVFSPDSQYIAYLEIAIGDPGFETFLPVIALGAKPKVIGSVTGAGTPAVPYPALGPPAWGP